MQDSSRRDVLRLSGAGLVGAFATPRVFAEAPGTAVPSETVFNVRAFGATGDGKTLDTDAVNRAIQAAAEKGGGTVTFPPGQYLCFSIHLKSFVDLSLASGCVIIAADGPGPGDKFGYNGGAYDPPEPKTAWDAYQDFGHNHWHNSLMWGEDLHDFSITGSGLIWGRGLSAGHGKPCASGWCGQQGDRA